MNDILKITFALDDFNDQSIAYRVEIHRVFFAFLIEKT